MKINLRLSINLKIDLVHLVNHSKSISLSIPISHIWGRGGHNWVMASGMGMGDGVWGRGEVGEEVGMVIGVDRIDMC